MSTFLLGSLSSLVSVALGYWAGGLRRAQDDRKRRKAVATALLWALRPLERQLRTRAQHSHAAESTTTISMPVYDRFVQELVLFPPEPVHVLLELRGFVREVELSASLFSTKPEVIGEKAHEFVRAKATLAANLIPAAKSALEAAGGTSPVDWEIQFIRRGVGLELVPPAFPNAAAMEGHKVQSLSTEDAS